MILKILNRLHTSSLINDVIYFSNSHDRNKIRKKVVAGKIHDEFKERKLSEFTIKNLKNNSAIVFDCDIVEKMKYSPIILMTCHDYFRYNWYVIWSANELNDIPFTLRQSAKIVIADTKYYNESEYVSQLHEFTFKDWGYFPHQIKDRLKEVHKSHSWLYVNTYRATLMNLKLSTI
jgi:hypothetical protein